MVYRYLPGGRYEKVLQTSGPVSALVCAGKRFFFAVGRDIYTYRHGQGLARLYRSPSGHTIEGLAYDPKTATVFFSAGSAVWALRGPLVTYIVGRLAGELRWHNGLLFVLDRKTSDFYALGGVSPAIRASARLTLRAPPTPGGQSVTGP